MRLLDRYRQLPASVGGRYRHDLGLGIADVALNTLWLLGRAGRTKRPPPGGELIQLRIAERHTVAHDQDVVAFHLVAADGGMLPRWYPGAHIDVHLPSGLIRQYSLCGDPLQDEHYRIAVRRIPTGGGGSVEIHGLKPGSVLGTQGPRNGFPFTVPGYGSPARRLHFIAGGIGITPILPMLRLAQQLGVDWSMVYTGRHRDSLPFLDELGPFGDRVRIRTDDEWGLPAADELLGACPDGTAVYACGPAPLLTALSSALADRRNVELHFERFAAAPVVDGSAFTATVASTGQQIRVDADRTLLSALTRAGVPAAYSCQQGFCGTCRVRVLDGTVDHRDTLLTADERAAQLMLTCVSRAAAGSDLTLDL